jgi:hypothetical protein
MASNIKAGYVKDRGVRGIEYVDKPIRLKGSSWVEPSGSAVFFDDFQTGVLDGNVWDVVSVQATSATNFAYSASAGGADGGHGGWVRGVTGTGDDDDEMLVQALNWTTLNLGNGTLVYETRLCAPVITTVGINAQLAVGTAPPLDDPFTLRIEIDNQQVAYFSMSNVPSGYTAGDGVGPLVFYGAVTGAGRSSIAMAPFISITARADTNNLALECDYVFCAAARSKA